MKNVCALWLPGFHVDDHNNKWWGEGFVEWDLVKSSRPQFRAHIQPKLPIDNKYYDLSNLDDLLHQFNQANSYGVDVIAGYHYWFKGERILDKPEKLLLDLGDLSVTFFSFWANHTWTRTWSNNSLDKEVLISQEYDLDDAISHADHVSKLMLKNFYFYHNGQPVFGIYDINDIINKCPDYLNVFTDRIKKVVGKYPLIVYSVKSIFDLPLINLNDNFIPYFHEPSFSLSLLKKNKNIAYKFLDILPEFLQKFIFNLYIKNDKVQNLNYSDAISLYNKYILNFDSKFIPSIFCGFDNTPRYKNRARIYSDFDILKFKEQLNHVNSLNSPFFIINALNEWGEGMMLEPCMEYGFQKFLAIKDVIERLNPLDDNNEV